MFSKIVPLKIISVAATAVAVLIVSSAMAQSYLDAASKARGDFGSRSAGRSMGSARSYARDYREYARGAPRVEPEVAQETTDAIGNYIVKAKKHMAWMRKQAAANNDTQTLASLDSIDKNLANAEKSHSEMCEVCMKATIDPAASMKCCQQIDDSLTAAIDEHDKLMKRLGMSTPQSK